MQILKYPTESLLKPSEPFAWTEADIQFAKDFIKFYADFNGWKKWGTLVGLAAPQVGKNLRLFCAIDRIFINPEMTPDPLEGMSQLKEGCYSLEENKFDYPTKRYYKIRLKWQNLLGDWTEATYKGFDAQVIQHEMDHLNGVLCHAI